MAQGSVLASSGTETQTLARVLALDHLLSKLFGTQHGVFSFIPSGLK